MEVEDRGSRLDEFWEVSFRYCRKALVDSLRFRDDLTI